MKERLSAEEDMDPIKANFTTQIEDAIRKLEMGSNIAAFQFLKDLGPEYAVALPALIEGLKSSNTDAQTTCALAVGRLGFEKEAVIDPLFKLLTGSADPFVKAAAAAALGDHISPLAALKLSEFLTEHVNDKTNSFLVQSALEALARLGGIASNFRGTFSEVREKATKSQRHFVNKAHEAFLKNIHNDLYAFAINSGAPLDQSEVQGYRPLAKLANYDLVLDRRVSLAQPLLDECRTLIFKQRKDTFGLEQPLHVVIFCQDELTLGSPMNRFESYVSTINSSGILPKDGAVVWCLYLWGYGEEVFSGKLSAVDVEFDEAPAVASWGNTPELQLILGEDYPKIHEHLAAGALPPEGFTEYCMGKRVDAVARQRYEEVQRSSPEGIAQYPAAEEGSIAKVVAAIVRNEVPAPKITLRPNYGDSFDKDGLDPDLLPELDRDLISAVVKSEEFGTLDIDDPLLETVILDEHLPSPITPPDYLPKMSLPWSAPRGDIVCLKIEVDEDQEILLTNVPWSVYEGHSGFSWGYTGGGPGALALNILNAFIPPRSDGAEAVEQERTSWHPKKRTFASATALMLHADFEREFIAKLPQEGGIISGERICDWILNKLSSKATLEAIRARGVKS